MAKANKNPKDDAVANKNGGAKKAGGKAKAEPKAKAKKAGGKAKAEPKVKAEKAGGKAKAEPKMKKVGSKAQIAQSAKPKADPKVKKVGGKAQIAQGVKPKAEAKAKKKAAGKAKKVEAKIEAKKAEAKVEAKKAEARVEAKKKAAGKPKVKADAKPKAAGKAKAVEAKSVEAKAEPKAPTQGKGKKKNKDERKGKRKSGQPTRAEQSNRHQLYQLSVQSPEADLEFFVDRYVDLRGHEPKLLREDFCGTALISATWAASGEDRRALGVDLDAATLQWGREHNLAQLSEDAKARVELRQANVLDREGEKADVTCAMNFSYGVFKTRAELRHYLEVAHHQLADDGMFVTELYGGTEAIVVVTDEREIEDETGAVGGFKYVWEQEAYNPITHETLCHIHFEFPDRSKIERAFTYVWRLWSIAELRELLYDVGFSSVRVYWEATDDDGDGTGEYYPTEKEENQESWLVYIVAAK